MAEKCRCECLLPWFSGFFAMPAVAHLIRIIGGWELSVNGEPFAMKTSWIVFIVCGLLSLIFGVIACRRHKAGETGASASCCS